MSGLERQLTEAKKLAGLAPNPENYDILDVVECGEYKVLLVHYPNCTNYKGLKCIVVKCKMVDLVKLKRLDPHFTEVVPPGGVEIFARFPPSDEGKALACEFDKFLSSRRG